MAVVETSFGGSGRGCPEQVTFHRRELNQILQVYGRRVASGEWKDYGISHLREMAVFCIFHRHAEMPLYRIEKRPKLAARQGLYAVIGVDGRVLKRGQDLTQVLRALEPRRLRVVED